MANEAGMHSRANAYNGHSAASVERGRHGVVQRIDADSQHGSSRYHGSTSAGQGRCLLLARRFVNEHDLQQACGAINGRRRRRCGTGISIDSSGGYNHLSRSSSTGAKPYQ